MNAHQLTPEEPLSPELVLVLPPELRRQALARLGRPVWPTPRPRALVAPAAPAASFARSMGAAVVARLVPLALIFVVVTIATLVLSLVAQAFSVR